MIEPYKNAVCSPEIIYIPEEVPRKVVFISDTKNDPNENRIQNKYRDDPYQRLTNSEELKTVPELVNNEAHVTIVAYERAKPVVAGHIDGLKPVCKLDNEWLPDEQVAVRKRIISSYKSAV